MADFWASRSGRWRIRMREETDGEIPERLFRVLRDEIEDGRLPPGAIVPPAQRIAEELRIEADQVTRAIKMLVAADLLVQRSNGRLCVADDSGDATVGDQTQVLFEQNLIKAARYATEMGISTVDATGVFRAKLAETLKARERDKDD